MAFEHGIQALALFPNPPYGMANYSSMVTFERRYLKQAVIVCVGHATWAAVIVAISTGFRGQPCAWSKDPVKGRPLLNLSQNQ